MLEEIIKKVLDNFKKKIEEITSELYQNILQGKLIDFEEQLHKACTDLYNQLACAFIVYASQSEELKEKAKIIGQKKGLGEVRKSETTLQLKTGYTIKITSWFALYSKPKDKRKRKKGGVHLLLEYWGCIQKASPSYYSLVAMLCMLCPSFDIAIKTLKNQGIECEYKRIQKIVYELGKRCFSDRVKMALHHKESLAGKRVIISIDGGRTRTRLYNEKKVDIDKSNKGKRKKFETPWREPKLFVIQTLEEDGSISKIDLPIYDCNIAEADACFDLLFQYLKQLQIEKAEQILFISDAAPWIWTRISKLFKSLGVDNSKLFQAVDYYHAVEHLGLVLNSFSTKKLPLEQRPALLKSLKNHLWNGEISEMVKTITLLAKGNGVILKKLDYFKADKMQYHILRSKKLPCGSGIVESAIRRIINLRFKSPSTFWNVKNVEKLIFLRAIFLAGRWNIMLQNLISKIQKKFQVAC